MTVSSYARHLAAKPAARGPALLWRKVKRSPRHVAAGLAIMAALAAAGWAGVRYWSASRFEVVTDDAYVKADTTIVAPKVAGYVAAVQVQDNQPVKAGQALALIDDRDYRQGLDQAAASAAAMRAAVAKLVAQITAQGSQIRQADASVAAAKVSLSLAQRNDARRREMARVGYGTDEQADDAGADAQEKGAVLQRLEAAAVAARQQVPVLGAQRHLAEAEVAQAEAHRRQAELDLGYTAIVSPIDGVVAARTVRQGQYVQTGSQLMGVVPLRRVYVVANFKETQLTRVQPGQPAHIRVDAFPDHDVQARVDSVAPASGLEFSLLPPDNATGNFTKIVQRIPVKIVLDPDNPLAGRLRPGMSVTAEIDTRSSR